jgi:hypothetical protein
VKRQFLCHVCDYVLFFKDFITSLPPALAFDDFLDGSALALLDDVALLLLTLPEALKLLLGSILRSRFGRNLRVKPNSVKFNELIRL